MKQIANHYRKILIAFPPLLIDHIDEQALKEFRSRSELVRQAMREYIERKTGVAPNITKESTPV